MVETESCYHFYESTPHIDCLFCRFIRSALLGDFTKFDKENNACKNQCGTAVKDHSLSVQVKEVILKAKGSTFAQLKISLKVTPISECLIHTQRSA